MLLLASFRAIRVKIESSRDAVYEETNRNTGIGCLRSITFVAITRTRHVIFTRGICIEPTRTESCFCNVCAPIRRSRPSAISISVFFVTRRIHRSLHVCIRACNVLWFAEPAILYARLYGVHALPITLSPLVTPWPCERALEILGVGNSLETWAY